MRTIRGKKALVTGAASGIGRAIALALAREGADLYLLDVDEPRLDLVAAEVRRQGGLVVTAYCDVARPEQVSARINAVLETWGALDILVNNAGVAYYGPTECMTAEQWERLLGINLLAPIQFTRELLPVLLAQPESHIVNVSSMFGLAAFGKLAAYHTSKYGLVGFSESLRAEFAHRGLGVTALCPGFVQTNLFQATDRGGAKPVRKPPAWICTSPEAVAAKAVQAILKNRGLVVFTPAARVLWFVKRLSPRLFEWLNRLGRRKRKADAKEAGSSTTKAAGKESLPRAA